MNDYQQPSRTPRYKFSARAEIIVEGSEAKQLCDVKELSPMAATSTVSAIAIMFWYGGTKPGICFRR